MNIKDEITDAMIEELLNNGEVMKIIVAEFNKLFIQGQLSAGPLRGGLNPPN